MRTWILLRYTGLSLVISGVFMFISALVSLYYADEALIPLMYSAFIIFILGLFPLIFTPKPDQVSPREALLIVTLSWLVSCLAGSIPYILFGGEFTFSNAWFESVSGYTTTGSTVLVEIESLPKGLLFWRASTHWIGGIGIVLFTLVLLPSMGKARLTLFRSEISQLAIGNLQYRSRKAINVLVIVYLALTISETILLSLAGMSVFDSVCHSFATIATGGFSTRNLSIAAYDSPLIESIIILFMILSGMHFGLLFMVFTLKPLSFFKSEVTRYYLISMFSGVIVVALTIYFSNDIALLSALRHAAFQVASLGTTTGFASIDSSVWHPFAIMILMFFTFQCACAGSTSGGLKADRVYILFKSIKSHFIRIAHPNAVYYTRIQGEVIQGETLTNIYFFILAYLLIFFITALALIAMNVDMLSAFSGSATTIGNVGPGFSVVGSLGNFSSIPNAGKWFLSANMLFGRLEIFSLVLIFYKHIWKN